MRAEFQSVIFWGLSLASCFATRFYFQPEPVMKVNPWMFWGGAIVGTGLVVRNFIACGRPVPKALLQKDLTGKVAIITGCAAGLGLEHAGQLAKQGATVVVACRSVKRNEEAAEGIKQRSGGKGTVITKYPLDLEDLNSARSFATEFLKSGLGLDFLVLNGGLADFKDIKYAKGNKNLDYSITINVLSHLILTEMMESKMKECRTRIVCLSSYAHTMVNKSPSAQEFRDAIFHTHENGGAALAKCSNRPAPWTNYGVGKLLNVHHAHFLASKGFVAAAVHPGFCSSEFGSNMFPGAGSELSKFAQRCLMCKSQEEGAWTQIWATLCDDSQLAPTQVSASGSITKLAPYLCDTTVMNSEMTVTAQDAAVAYAGIQACLELIKKY